VHSGVAWASESLLNFSSRSFAPRSNKKFKIERPERIEERTPTAVDGRVFRRGDCCLAKVDARSQRLLEASASSERLSSLRRRSSSVPSCFGVRVICSMGGLQRLKRAATATKRPPRSRPSPLSGMGCESFFTIHPCLAKSAREVFRGPSARPLSQLASELETCLFARRGGLARAQFSLSLRRPSRASFESIFQGKFTRSQHLTAK
jgi:hypothetical protein